MLTSDKKEDTMQILKLLSLSALIFLSISAISEESYKIVKSKGDFQNPAALKKECSRSLKIDLSGLSKGSIWIRAFGSGMEMRFKHKGKSLTTKWLSVNSHGKWKWRKIANVNPEKFDEIFLYVPRPLDKNKKLRTAIDCAVITRDQYIDISKVYDKLGVKFKNTSTAQKIPASGFLVLKKGKDDKNVYKSPKAFKKICSRTVRFNLKKSNSPYYIWLRLKGSGLEIRHYKHGVGVYTKWYNFNSGGKWIWKGPVKFSGDKYDQIEFLVPRPLDKAGKLRSAIDCGVLTQRKSLNLLEVYKEMKVTPPLSLARKIHEDKSIDCPQTVPLPDKDTYIINISGSANLSANPENTKLKIISCTQARKYDFAGIRLNIKPTGKTFIGVWKKVSKESLKHRRVKAVVAQSGDKVRVGVNLPEKVKFPVNKKFSSLSFLHTVKGAGEFGDELFCYELEYADGRKIIIPVNEGERIGGQLKPVDISKGNKVFDNLIDSRTLCFYITSWKNPFPDKIISSITITAITPKIVPVLLAVAGHKKWLKTFSDSQKTYKKVYININLSKKLKKVKLGLFGVNVPCLCMADYTDKFYKTFRELNIPVVRAWNRGKPKNINDKIDYELLDKHIAGMKKLTANSDTKLFMNLIPRLPKWIYKGGQAEKHIDFLADWYFNVLCYYVKKGCKISAIEIFNEVLIGHNKTNMLHFKFYNKLASKIKAKFSKMPIGGTAECWPDRHIIGKFAKNCRKYIDFVSWHMYPTGSNKTPTIKIMERTDRYSQASIGIDQTLKKYFLAKKIPQAISEYNMNYAAWKNGTEKRQLQGIGMVWLFSVLRDLLYEGRAEQAMLWHFYRGSTFGMVDRNYSKRASWYLFKILIEALKNSRLCKVSCNDKMVEVLAAGSKKGKCIVIANKNGHNVKASLAKFKLSGIKEIVEYRIQGEEEVFTKSRLNSIPDNFELKKNSLIIWLIKNK